MIRLMLSALLLVPSLAAADRVTVKGTVLEGTVKSITAKEVVMSTVYGKGDLRITTADVTAIETDMPFHVYPADAAAQQGRIVAVTPETLSLAQSEGGVAEIPFDQVEAAPRGVAEDANWIERQRVTRPWWSGNLDLSFASFDAATRTTALTTGFGLRRERGPNLTRFNASYLRSASREEEDDPFTADVDERQEDVTGDELRGTLRHDYDLTPRLFSFGSLEAEHDGIEQIALRLVPTLGAGYKLIKTESLLLGADTGLAYVYQRYFGGDTENYPSLAFGTDFHWKLPWLDAVWHTRVDYLPSVIEPSDNYRLRGESALLVPIVDQLSLKASLIDDYNSRPADDAIANSLTTLLGLSLSY